MIKVVLSKHEANIVKHAIRNGFIQKCNALITFVEKENKTTADKEIIQALLADIREEKKLYRRIRQKMNCFYREEVNVSYEDSNDCNKSSCTDISSLQNHGN